MTILEVGCCSGAFGGDTKWAGIIAWNCSLVMAFGASSLYNATAFLAVGNGEGSTFLVAGNGEGCAFFAVPLGGELKNCSRAPIFKLGELQLYTWYKTKKDLANVVNQQVITSQVPRCQRRRTLQSCIIWSVGHVAVGTVETRVRSGCAEHPRRLELVDRQPRFAFNDQPDKALQTSEHGDNLVVPSSFHIYAVDLKDN